MTLIELLEYFRGLVRVTNREHAISVLVKDMGVSKEVVEAISASVDDSGKYIRSRI